MHGQSFKMPDPHRFKKISQVRATFLLVINFEQNLQPNSHYNTLQISITSRHSSISISATPTQSINAKMPCWSCHLCNEWNQPHYESCIECCHRQCRSCKVHYAMSYNNKEASTLSIPVHNARFFKSGTQVRDYPKRHPNAKANYSSRTESLAPVAPNFLSTESYLISQVTDVFLSAPDSSNMNAFLANQDTDSLVETNSEKLKKKAAETWSRVKERGIKSG